MRLNPALCLLATLSLLGGQTALADTAQTAELDAYPGMTEHAKLIREGKLDLGRRYSMHPEQGRFHIVHVDEIDMECTSCHVAEGFATDYQILRKVQAEQKAEGIGKGEQADVIDRTVCLGCHKGGGIATRWFGTVAQ